LKGRKDRKEGHRRGRGRESRGREEMEKKGGEGGKGKKEKERGGGKGYAMALEGMNAPETNIRVRRTQARAHNDVIHQ